MVQNHLKRIATPKTWSILRKSNVFITKPNPGAHTTYFGTSINTMIKEMIGLATTTKEVKKMLHDGEVLVDGKRRHDEKHSIGFMDVISFPKVKKSYRLILSEKGKLMAHKINDKEKDLKLAKIKNKTIIKGGKVQLSFTDGRTLTVEKDSYKVGDSLLLALPSQEIKGHYPYTTGASVVIMSGKHAGEHGTIENIEGNALSIKTKDGSFLTRKTHAFITGDKTAAITCSP